MNLESDEIMEILYESSITPGDIYLTLENKRINGNFLSEEEREKIYESIEKMLSGKESRLKISSLPQGFYSDNRYIVEGIFRKKIWFSGGGSRVYYSNLIPWVYGRIEGLKGDEDSLMNISSEIFEVIPPYKVGLTAVIRPTFFDSRTAFFPDEIKINGELYSGVGVKGCQIIDGKPYRTGFGLGTPYGIEGGMIKKESGRALKLWERLKEAGKINPYLLKELEIGTISINGTEYKLTLLSRALKSNIEFGVLFYENNSEKIFSCIEGYMNKTEFINHLIENMGKEIAQWLSANVIHMNPHEQNWILPGQLKDLSDTVYVKEKNKRRLKNYIADFAGNTGRILTIISKKYSVDLNPFSEGFASIYGKKINLEKDLRNELYKIMKKSYFKQLN